MESTVDWCIYIDYDVLLVVDTRQFQLCEYITSEFTSIQFYVDQLPGNAVHPLVAATQLVIYDFTLFAGSL